MTDERRFSSSEIEIIFAEAARDGLAAGAGAAGDGLSLTELQAIGGEVGLPAQRIAAAAAILDQQRPQARRLTVAGVPIGVRVACDLPRAPTEREWGMLVAELRRTFQAEGRVTAVGELREWRNGSLYATIEPTERGYQLRTGTRKSQAPSLIVGSVMMALLALGRIANGAVPGAIMLMALSLLFLAPLFRLSGWVNLRKAQMDGVGQWMSELLGVGAGADTPPAVVS